MYIGMHINYIMHHVKVGDLLTLGEWPMHFRILLYGVKNL